MCDSSPARTRARPSTPPHLARVERWWIVIGSSPMLESIDWRHYARDAQMVVLSGDPRIPIDDLPQSTIRLAYVSVGEADPRRPYWSEVRGQPFLVEPNPEWPDNLRVDIRDTRWQEVLMCEEVAAPDAARVRRADARHRSTPPRTSRRRTRRDSPGSRQALRDWLQRLRKAFPRAVAGRQRQRRAGRRRAVRRRLRGRGRVLDLRRPPANVPRTTDAERDWKLARDRARARRRAAAGVHDRVRRRRRRRRCRSWASEESLRHGFRPYVGVRDLNTAP